MNNLAKISISTCAVVITAFFSLHAGTSPQEKAFTDKYKTAFEGKDTATLESFLYTQGADPGDSRFLQNDAVRKGRRENIQHRAR
jgi:hypothetical protein